MGFAGGVDSVAGDTVADSNSSSGYSTVGNNNDRTPITREQVDRNSRDRSDQMFGTGGNNQPPRSIQPSPNKPSPNQPSPNLGNGFGLGGPAPVGFPSGMGMVDFGSFPLDPTTVGTPTIVAKSMPSGLEPTVPSGMMANQNNLFDFGYTDPTSTAMRMQGDTERNLSNLGTLDPGFQSKVAGTLDDVMDAGKNPYLVSTARTFTPAQQPGGPMPAEDSYHKYGLAVDIGLTGENPQDYKLLGDIGAGRDLGWGGSFSNNYDPMHLQAGPVGMGATDYASSMGVPKVQVSGQPFLESGGGSLKDYLTSSLDKVISGTKQMAGTALDTAGAATQDALKTYVDRPIDNLFKMGYDPVEDQKQYNRDRLLSQEEMDIDRFNRLHPEANSDKEKYGGRDSSGIASLGKANNNQAQEAPQTETSTQSPQTPVYTTGIDTAIRDYVGGRIDPNYYPYSAYS